MSKSIRILNAHHGSGYTSAKNAARYVARGVARWDGKGIRLIETDYRFNSEALPSRVTHAPKLPDVQPLPLEANWLNSEAAVSWRYQDTQGIPA